MSDSQTVRIEAVLTPAWAALLDRLEGATRREKVRRAVIAQIERELGLSEVERAGAE